jgi:hypothetical protein
MVRCNQCRFWSRHGRTVGEREFSRCDYVPDKSLVTDGGLKALAYADGHDGSDLFTAGDFGCVAGEPLAPTYTVDRSHDFTKDGVIRGTVTMSVDMAAETK